MDRFPYDAAARDDKLQQLIDARSQATEQDIFTNRTAIVRAVAELASAHPGDRGLNCDADEAEALVRAAVAGRSVLVGARIAEVVSFAIYSYVLPLAQADLADAERKREEAAQHSRIELHVWNRFFSRVPA
jgi:hypothetical protein